MSDIDTINYEVPAEELSIDNAGIANALDRANWNLRKLADIHQRRHETDQLFTLELQRITQRRDDELAKYDRAIEWHERPLRELHTAILAEDPTRKSIVLPHGTLKSRTPKTPRLIIDDAAALATWARSNGPGIVDALLPRPAQVGVKNLSALAEAKACEDGTYLVVQALSGEVIPGVRAELGDTTFSIDLPGDDL